VPSFNNQGSEILMFHILEGINEEKNRNGTNRVHAPYYVKIYPKYGTFKNIT
jgi:hypothetical protein